MVTKKISNENNKNITKFQLNVTQRWKLKQTTKLVTISLMQIINYGKNIWGLRAKTNIKPELKMDVVWNTCDR